ncbi:hypothetical protein QM334_39105, partial [Burkholderia cenocepacia]|nr:hypothetical protein [Burkholderia cenocepacia]
DLVAITAQRRLDRYFDTIVGSPTAKADAFAHIVRSGRWLPDQVLAIGDSMTEFHAAANTGMPFAETDSVRSQQRSRRTACR